MAAQKYPSVDSLGLRDAECGSNGFLYVAQLASGLIKVGSTRTPRERACQLQREWGQAVVAMSLERLPEDAHRFDTERHAVGKISERAKPVKGREYFRDISFSEAKAVIAEVAKKPIFGVVCWLNRHEASSALDCVTLAPEAPAIKAPKARKG